jgi:transposase
MKSATLEKLQCAARANAIRLVYLDEVGFAASPPVQRAWSPRGLPHCVEPRFHCRRSVLGALDFGANTLAYHLANSSIKGDAVVEFLEQIARQADERPTVVVLDNASIHHAIDSEVLEHWLREHRMLLFYLPPYSPELNLIEILWKQAKYHWRNFVTWTKETIDEELRHLFDGYGTKYQISFA